MNRDIVSLCFYARNGDIMPVYEQRHGRVLDIYRLLYIFLKGLFRLILYCSFMS